MTKKLNERIRTLEAALSGLCGVADSALSDDDTSIVESMRLRQAVDAARVTLRDKGSN